MKKRKKQSAKAVITKSLQKIPVKKAALYLAVSLFLFLAAAWSERNTSVFSAEGLIERNPAGGVEKEVDLLLNGDGIPKDYDYHLTVEAAKVTEEEAEGWFALAKEEIENSLYSAGDGPDHVTGDLNMQDSYADGLVTAEWFLEDYKLISVEGKVNNEELTEPMITEARVELSCGDYQEIYEFFLAVCPQELTQTEALMKKIGQLLTQEYESGESFIRLPESVDGISLQWSEKKQYLARKLLFLELAAGGLLLMAEEERKREREKKRREAIEREYPRIVSKLAILMGAGMSLKMAWKLLVQGYQEDHRRGLCAEKPACEEMLAAWREMQDGESERIAYQKFGERCGCACFLRLSRNFVQNLSKGNARLCQLLQQEAEDAYAQRRLMARKQGEEAGTKLLLPLLLMMAIVMAIVIMPAILSFNV